ncbi:hypothetical protein SUGI_0544190 [Cryptomeria japonica]|nr:hypothetical protein SUGI_0544190 [Cryptomeria japonica]
MHGVFNSFEFEIMQICLGNWSYTSASWKQSLELRNQVPTGILQIIGLSQTSRLISVGWGSLEKMALD